MQDASRPRPVVFNSAPWTKRRTKSPLHLVLLITTELLSVTAEVVAGKGLLGCHRGRLEKLA
jgi:hypothetical protein